MAINQLLTFATGVGANVISQVDYAALPGRTAGFVDGVAIPEQHNKAMRQASFTSAMIGEFTADHSGFDTLDDGDVETYLDHFRTAIQNVAKLFSWIGGVAGGTANALTLTIDPSFTTYAQLLYAPIFLIAGNTNTGATTLNINGIGALPLTKRDTAAMAAGDVLAGSGYILFYDGTRFRMYNFVASDIGSIVVSIVPKSVPSPTLWVRTDGNDSNDGSANTTGAAMLTLQGAINKAADIFNLAGRILYVKMGNTGTYAGFSTSHIPYCLVQGNESNPDAYVITNQTKAGQWGPAGCVSGTLHLSGLRLSNLYTAHQTLEIAGGAHTILNTVSFQTPAAFPWSHIIVWQGGNLTVGTGAMKFVGSATAALAMAGGDCQFVSGSQIVLTGTPHFSIAFLHATLGSRVSIGGVGVTVSGASTGKKYHATGNSTVFLSTTVLPGDLAGSAETGAVVLT
jgi:hypothetical protein